MVLFKLVGVHGIFKDDCSSPSMAFSGRMLDELERIWKEMTMDYRGTILAFTLRA
jgi:hypothetical protein